MNVLGFSGLDTSIAFKKREFPGLTEREYNIVQGLDAAAALVSDGKVVAAAAEERFTRKKATNAFPSHAFDYCLQRAGLKIADVDFVAHGFDYEPYRQIIEVDDYGRRQFAEVFAPEIQKRFLAAKFGEAGWDQKFVTVPHHLAHAASAFYPSGFSDALILVSDGMGEVSSMTVFTGRATEITEITRVSAFHSLGMLYGVFSLYLGFFMNSDEYKIMGLAPYGNPKRFLDRMMEFISLRPDGTYTIPLFAQNRTLLERETHRGILRLLVETFGPAREPESEITQLHKDIAAALQAVLQMTQLHVLRYFKRQTGLKNLCLAGGVALNCSANGAIRRSDLFDGVFVQPAAGDDGTALGAALYVARQQRQINSVNTLNRLNGLNEQKDLGRGGVPLWGPEYSGDEIARAIAGRNDIELIKTESFHGLCKEVALRINRGEIIGWFQGRMEFGPRALGSRSILADPRDGGMREKINALVKKREGFRPFAPVVAREKAAEIFEIRPGDEETFSHMLYVTYVRGPYRDKLPATTHVDGSARAQTVSKEQNPRLWQLLQSFAELSRVPVLLNTSFNVRGQPIVCTPTEAIDTFLAARLDALVLGDTLLVRKFVAQSSGSDHTVPFHEHARIRPSGINAAVWTSVELQEIAARNEEFWVNRLCELQPVSLPYSRTIVSEEQLKTAQGFNIGSAILTNLSPQGSADAGPNGRSNVDRTSIIAAFGAFVYRITGSETFDLLFGDADLRACVGTALNSFATWLPLKIELNSEKSAKDIQFRVGNELGKLSDHSTYALELAERHVALKSGGQLKNGLANLPLAVQIVERIDQSDLAPGTELTLNIPTSGTDLAWCFDRAVFDESVVRRIARHFEHFFCQWANSQDTRVGEIGLVSQEELAAIQNWNATECQFPNLLMHEPFEAQAAATPDKIALVCADEHVSYGELNALAETIAAELRAQGVNPDEPVGLYANVSTEMVAGLLGILKAGGAYLPLDPDFPGERVAFMLEDSRARVVLTQTDLVHSLPKTDVEVICIDQLLSHRKDRVVTGTDRTGPGATPENLAYVIYTSGSTGKPKGVTIEHRNVANFYHAMDRALGTEPGVWLAVTSISFDISVLELFWTLSRGYKVVLQPKMEAKRGKRIAAEGSEINRQKYGQAVVAENNGATHPAERDSYKSLGFSLFYFAADEAADGSDKYRLLLEGAKFADVNGFEAIWTPERHFHAFGGLYPNPSVTSAAIAAITRQIRIRAGSVVAPLHDPIRIAEEWAVVDNLSNGRVALSFASGWQVNDFVLAPENYAKRKEQMIDCIEAVRRLWRGEMLLRKNPNGQEIPIRILPRPVQAELPIWITASGNPDTFQLAGELGANVLTHLLGQTLSELERKIQVYRDAWKKAAHPGEGRVTLMLHTYVHQNGDVARETVRRPFTAYLRTSADLIRNDPWAFSTFKRPGSLETGDRDLKRAPLSEEELDAMAEHAFERHFETSGLFGTPDHCLELLRKIENIGVGEIGCLIDFGLPQETVLSGLRELAKLKENVAASRGAADGHKNENDGKPDGDSRTLAESSIRRSQSAELETDYSIPAQIIRHRVTHMQCTPSLAMMLLEEPRALNALRSLKKLLLGGEALPSSLVQKLDIPGEILNMYGPTETTVWSAVQPIDRGDNLVSIGRPITNTHFYVVDNESRPVPIGVPGELLIGGAGVARGYLHQPELTADRFVLRPVACPNGAGTRKNSNVIGQSKLLRVGDSHSDNQGSVHESAERFYRTGDLVRFLPNGSIEFLGRLDLQVKLRGYRIELGEVESVLRRHPAVKDAATIVREDVPGDKRLVAYIIPQPGAMLEPRELRQFAAGMLPEYMVPSAFVPVTAFPLTPNGKLDRKGLPRPEKYAPEIPGAESMNLTEAKVAELMCGVLGLKQIGMRDDFFELGGNSLLATQLIGRLRHAFRWELPLRLAFEFPTVEGLARAISEKTAKNDLEIGAEPFSREPGSIAPMSFAQQRIWFLHQLEPGPHYNDHFDLRIRGPLNAAVVKRAINEIVQRHQTLRSIYRESDGKPQLEILSRLDVEVPTIDLTHLPEQDRLPEATKLAVQDCQKLFDLEKGPLFRASLARMSPEDHLLILTFDHIMVDGWSHGVFLSELSAHYAAIVNGQSSSLPEVSIEYEDYARWQLEQFETGAWAGHVEFWKAQLHGAPAMLRLATDFPRPDMQSYRGAREFFTIKRDLMDRINRLARTARCTAYMVLLSAFEVLLSRRSGQTDFVIGSPVANRSRTDVEGLIGSFMNTLALRSDLPRGGSFKDLVGRVRHRVLEALAHQDLPFEKLVLELQPERALGYSPVFQVMFILQNTPAPASNAADITFNHFEIDGGSSKMDLTLNLEETEQGTDGWMEYSTDLFRPETVRQMVAEYVAILEGVCANPEVPILLSVSSADTRSGSSESGRVVIAGRGIAPVRPEGVKASSGSLRAHPDSLHEIQGTLASIWSDVLNTPKVGMDSNLFDLGGHSLLITQIISRIRKTWGVNVPIQHFFDDPTVRVISGIIEKELEMRDVSELT